MEKKIFLLRLCSAHQGAFLVSSPIQSPVVTLTAVQPERLGQKPHLPERRQQPFLCADLAGLCGRAQLSQALLSRSVLRGKCRWKGTGFAGGGVEGALASNPKEQIRLVVSPGE